MTAANAKLRRPSQTSGNTAKPQTLGLPRVASSSKLRRAESAPDLTAIFEPDANLSEDEFDDQPAYMNSYSADGPPRRSISLDKPVVDICSSGGGSGSIVNAQVPVADSGLPGPWAMLLSKLAAAGSSLSPLSQAELVAEAVDSLKQQGRPLRLQPGLLDDYYEMRSELASGDHFSVKECVERKTQRNYSLKMLTSASGLRATKPLDPMQAFYLICSFVEEVFCHPQYTAIVMKWGMHEVDSSHQLSCLILEAIQLLSEVLPPERSQKCRYLRLSTREIQQLLLRTLSLDVYLQTHLFIQ